MTPNEQLYNKVEKKEIVSAIGRLENGGIITPERAENFRRELDGKAAIRGYTQSGSQFSDKVKEQLGKDLDTLESAKLISEKWAKVRKVAKVGLTTV